MSENLRKIFAANVVKLRKPTKLTQEQFAELIDISLSSMSDIERGATMPKPETIAKIAEKLNVEAYELFIDYENDASIDATIKAINKILKNNKDNDVFINSVYFFIKEIIKRSKMIK